MLDCTNYSNIRNEYQELSSGANALPFTTARQHNIVSVIYLLLFKTYITYITPRSVEDYIVYVHVYP